MAVDTIEHIRSEVKRYIDFADDKTVKMIHAMLETEQEEDSWGNEAFVAELERRDSEYETGNAKVFTIDEMEENARRNFKHNRK